MSNDRAEAARSQYRRAVADRADTWVPACGGNEVPFTHNGTRWLYVFNPGIRKHGYLNLNTDQVCRDFRGDFREVI